MLPNVNIFLPWRSDMKGQFFFVFHGFATLRCYYTVMGKQSTDNTLTVAQVAGRLRKSDKWVRERLHTGEIPSVWLGGRMTIFEADLDKFVAGLRKVSRA